MMKQDLLKDHIDQIRGVSYKDGDAIDRPKPGYLPILRSNNIGEGSINLDNLIYVKSEIIKNVQRFRIGDILVTASTGSKTIIGKNGTIRELIDGSFGAFCKVVRPRKSINSDYLKHFFQSSYYRTTIRNVINGANINNIKNEHLDNLLIPLPPLETQKKIAAILDEADKLRQLNRQLIEKYDALTQSLFLEMFGDPVTNPKGWEKKCLSQMGVVQTGNTPSRSESSYYNEKYIEWIKTDNINTPETYITTADEYLSKNGVQKGRTVEANSLLVTCIAGSRKVIGNVAITDRKVAFNQQINSFTPFKGNIFFFYQLFKIGKHHIQNFSTNGMKGIITKSKFESIDFIDVPAEIQEAFGNFFKSVENQKSQAQASLQKSEELFQSLLQRAFKGELV